MEHTASTSDIILNVVIQVINIAIFFFLFIRFVGKPITKALVEKIEKEKKLAYNTRITEASKLADSIVAEAHAHKSQLEKQAEMSAKQKQQDIIDEAHRKADVIADNAEKQSKLLRAQMEQKFTNAVSSTVHKVVDKLFEEKDAHTTYVEKLVDEFAKSAQKPF
jgi:F0F1-type ATP synthase membrane subunit b/b'